MKLLILGGKGMAGYMTARYLKVSTSHDVYVTSRNKEDTDSIYIDARDEGAVRKTILSLQPDVVINCIGILNDNAAQHPIDAIQLNSLLPHQLAAIVETYGGRLIHISTDCIFLGDRGDYEEADLSDGTTVYAKTKALGEVHLSPHFTIRTSIIGPELKDGIGLFHWFMKQKGTIRGFDQVLWNGVTTLELAKAIKMMLEQPVTGIYHLVSPEKVSKYELLTIMQNVFDKQDVTIEKDKTHRLNRTLKNTRKDFSYAVPTYRTMLQELIDWMDQEKGGKESGK